MLSGSSTERYYRSAWVAWFVYFREVVEPGRVGMRYFIYLSVCVCD